MTTDVPRIAGAGICCMDYIVVAPQVPWGETASVSDYKVQGGGLVATALVACGRLGASCQLFSYLGRDAVGDEILRELQDERVDISSVVKSDTGGSPFSFIHVDENSGERTIFHRSGADLKNGAPKDGEIRIFGYDVLLIDDVYPELALAAARQARANGIPVVADLVPGEKNAELLSGIDVMIAPRHYARKLGLDDDLDSALDKIHKLGPTIAVITLGAEGWVYSDPKGRGRGEAFRVDVVDTTGAGDSFHGAFAYALARGWDTAKCAEFASAVAAMKCTKPGGRTGLHTLDQVYGFLRQRSKLKW